MIPVRVADRYKVNLHAWVRGDATSLPYDWLCEHIKKFNGGQATWWHDTFDIFYFENQEDAVLFALHWT